MKNEQESLKERREQKGRFVVICDRSLGFVEDPDEDLLKIWLDDTALVRGRIAWQFLQDHPFGVDPEPYAEGVPDSFPDWCTR